LHESPVANELVRAAVIAAEQNGVDRITRMVLALGPEGNYIPDSLETHILAAAVGTSAEGCEVNITPVESGGAVLVSIESGDDS
jgi:Zn finger protein HypA/HybF involved in hydrogenase expression